MSDHDDHGGNAKYWIVFLCLCGLTSCSFLTFFEWWNDSVPKLVSQFFMMAVSCAKALLVMLFFMHLKWEANWKWVLTVPCGIMGIFLLCMLMPDVLYRTAKYSAERRIHAPFAVVESADHHAAEPAKSVGH
ncbi:MAG: hypothetical protein COA78_13140 [Blastopirellula sp.]|nr:MAG: hypothetical protein COA78_13140 [Blastopirellula sp.]